ncbi:NAD-dependent malic enzyme, partial [Paenibacillus sepulcri]|nr:NAD-dependent malic enzyme [Paenibacillus sepulcri]
VDREGIICRDHHYPNGMWQWYAEHTNDERMNGGLAEALKDADVFIGLSAGGILKRELVMSMAPDPIVFAMANPEPEIRPETAEDIVAVIATGRSDYPNQINNVLCFPG